jgi:hypothetical protein
MSICYKCREIFYGDECDYCGWQVNYKCWRCKAIITSEENIKCHICGWFICSYCEACGCDEDRPQSNEEKMQEMFNNEP